VAAAASVQTANARVLVAIGNENTSMANVRRDHAVEVGITISSPPDMRRDGVKAGEASRVPIGASGRSAVGHVLATMSRALAAQGDTSVCHC
jgi:hypothetical protein